MDSLYAEGLVVRDTIAFRELRSEAGVLRFVHVRGRIICVEHVRIAVSKYLHVALNRRNQLLVKGMVYSYHAWQGGRQRRDLARYDNSHDLGELHRHFFDEHGREVAQEPVSYDSLPRLDLIIREAVALARGTPLIDIYRRP